MPRLDVGTPAAAAWDVLHLLSAGSAAVTDAQSSAAEALWRERHPVGAASGMTPSGAAGLAALIEVAEDEQARSAFGLDEDARVLVYMTETTR